jgi:Transcription regulator Rua1, C-terminal
LYCGFQSGVCARNNAPFSPPLQSRVTPRPRASVKERKEIKEGLCHVCQQWIPLQGTKDVDVMVKEIFWFVFLPFHFTSLPLLFAQVKTRAGRAVFSRPLDKSLTLGYYFLIK